MNPQEAKLIAGYTLADFDRERVTTRNVIAAIPEGHESYTPDARSMTAIDLAWHIAGAEAFFLNGVIHGEFKAGESNRPESIKTAKDVLAWYDSTVPPILESAKALDAESLSKTVDFYGMMQLPAFVYLTLMVKHEVHHRGQLSAYLRPMGAKVPGIYGPSADAPVDKK